MRSLHVREPARPDVGLAFELLGPEMDEGAISEATKKHGVKQIERDECGGLIDDGAMVRPKSSLENEIRHIWQHLEQRCEPIVMTWTWWLLWISKSRPHLNLKWWYNSWKFLIQSAIVMRQTSVACIVWRLATKRAEKPWVICCSKISNVMNMKNAMIRLIETCRWNRSGIQFRVWFHGCYDRAHVGQRLSFNESLRKLK